MDIDVKGGDVVVATGAVRMEGTSKEYCPIEYPAVSDVTVSSALVQAAKKLGADFHTGVVQCKDAFYGQHMPEALPNSHELAHTMGRMTAHGMQGLPRWNPRALHCRRVPQSESSSSVFLVVANQEREKAGLPNMQEHDTDLAIRVAIEAIRLMIAEEKKEGR